MYRKLEISCSELINTVFYEVDAAMFSPDGKLIASASNDYTVRYLGWVSWLIIVVRQNT